MEDPAATSPANVESPGARRLDYATPAPGGDAEGWGVRLAIILAFAPMLFFLSVVVYWNSDSLAPGRNPLADFLFMPIHAFPGLFRQPLGLGISMVAILINSMLWSIPVILLPDGWSLIRHFIKSSN